MDRDSFVRICSHIHKNAGVSQYSFTDCMKVLDMYFDYYREFMGREHPVPSYKQLVTVMEAMPHTDEARIFDLSPSDYEVLIPAYFLTDFPGCDRNISHFFSGQIRLYRYYENLY